MIKNCEVKLLNDDLLKMLMQNNIASHNAKNLKWEFHHSNPNILVCKWEENSEIKNSENPIFGGK